MKTIYCGVPTDDHYKIVVAEFTLPIAPEGQSQVNLTTTALQNRNVKQSASGGFLAPLGMTMRERFNQ